MSVPTGSPAAEPAAPAPPTAGVVPVKVSAAPPVPPAVVLPSAEGAAPSDLPSSPSTPPPAAGAGAAATGDKATAVSAGEGAGGVVMPPSWAAFLEVLQRRQACMHTHTEASAVSGPSCMLADVRPGDSSLDAPPVAPLPSKPRAADGDNKGPADAAATPPAGDAPSAAAATEPAPAAPASTVSMDASAAVATIRRFQALQEDRVFTYKAFDEAFATMLRVADFEAFPHVVAAVTRTFADISTQARACEAELRKGGFVAPADMIVRVQAQEKSKLRLTAHAQILRQRESSVAAGDDTDAEAAVAADLHEATVALHATVSEINDALEELRYEVAELELPVEDAE